MAGPAVAQSIKRASDGASKTLLEQIKSAGQAVRSTLGSLLGGASAPAQQSTVAQASTPAGVADALASTMRQAGGSAADGIGADGVLERAGNTIKSMGVGALLAIGAVGVLVIYLQTRK